MGALAIVGGGRLGGSIANALSAEADEVQVFGRSFDPDDLTERIVLICVPDDEIPSVVARLAGVNPGPVLVGHTSGAADLEVLQAAGAQEGTFSVHPLQTVPDDATDLTGAPAAVAGSNGGALSFARDLAQRLGMVPFGVEEELRVLYHAAASIASNFLVTLQQEASDLMELAGVENPRATLAPLVKRSLDNWIEQGPEALTGPVARGDAKTVEAHREALAIHAPGLLELYDLMAKRTAGLSEGGVPG